MSASEYLAVSRFYGDRCARRSGVRLMNHIDEGLKILSWIGASDVAARGFCLHPLIQETGDFVATMKSDLLDACHPRAVALAVEYRAVANAALSFHSFDAPADIRLAALDDVNNMLIADKVQNYKDFLRYHAETHPRTATLDRYFRFWLARLGISVEQFFNWTKLLEAGV